MRSFLFSWFQQGLGRDRFAPLTGNSMVPRGVKVKSFLKILLAGIIIALCCGLLFAVS